MKLNAIRIIDGDPVQPDMYPWILAMQVKLSYGYKNFCVGSIINEYTVLTAAHYRMSFYTEEGVCNCFAITP